MNFPPSPPLLDTTRFIASHVAGLRRSGIRDFFELVAKTDGVISLGIGEPDFDTPQPIRDAVKTAMDTGKTHYTSNLGLPELRKEISRYVESYFHVGYSWENEVLVTVGVSEALDLACRALLNPGDKVLYHQPCYVSYAPTVELVHGVGVPVATSASEQFSLDAPALRAAWQPGCKLLLLNLPCNPTGGVCSKEQLERIAKFALEDQLRVDLVADDDEVLLDGELRGHPHEHRQPAGHAGTHVAAAWFFQGFCDDRIPAGLCLRPGTFDRGDDEGAPVFHAVRSEHQPGRCAGGPAAG